MERYVTEIIAGGHADASQGKLLTNRDNLGFDDYLMIHARHLARVQHDWHGRQFGDSRLGRPLYAFNPELGVMELGWWNPDEGGWQPLTARNETS